MPSKKQVHRLAKSRRSALKNSGNPRDLELYGTYVYAVVSRRNNGWMVRLGSDGVAGDTHHYLIADDAFGDDPLMADTLYAFAATVAFTWCDPDIDEAEFKSRVKTWGLRRADVTDYRR